VTSDSVYSLSCGYDSYEDTNAGESVANIQDRQIEYLTRRINARQAEKREELNHAEDNDWMDSLIW
jgi:hypothetical protein